ncbi:ribosomal protein L18E [Cenarchaeum symbiosum A]|uniref:Large ribosomal subunit protein eL18 n=1 Tax=Cenarchaeum symbiosum (strain A) TaxID=414004 RepID=A0RXP6_CENSY|nr:ribosomal protein L18E [Cenarchaeum symbiosum A]
MLYLGAGGRAIMASQITPRLAHDLKRASRANDAPIWLRLSRLAQKPTRARRTLNLNKIARYTKEGDVVVVPGRVLGTGSMPHKITLCPFGISGAAAEKVLSSGGRVTGFAELTKEFPTGKGVVLLG